MTVKGKHEQRRSLSKRQRTGVMILIPIEIVATTLAVVDLARRPRTQIRGPKALWWPALLVQPFGPLAYLALARRRL